MKVSLASNNPGKLKELRSLLAPSRLSLVGQRELGIESAPETGITFIENALEKARHVSRISGLATLADDSGLVVDALGGAPGVFSARFAGPAATDADNNAKLLTELADIRNPTAHYYCALVFLAHAEDPCPLVVTGRWDGQITFEARGANGFGYDPYFYLPTLGITAAELDGPAKNRLSHRGQAMAGLLDSLPRKLEEIALGRSS